LDTDRSTRLRWQLNNAKSFEVQMTELDDPRVYFAAERTLLAWLRTGLTVVGLGFVVARFGLFLQMMHNAPATSSAMSTTIGVSLVLLGAGAMAMAAWQHARFNRSLGPQSLPAYYVTGWSIWFAVTLSAAGIILAIHMVSRSVAD
jgi:putative membrane protein